MKNCNGVYKGSTIVKKKSFTKKSKLFSVIINHMKEKYHYEIKTAYKKEKERQVRENQEELERLRSRQTSF